MNTVCYEPDANRKQGKLHKYVALFCQTMTSVVRKGLYIVLHCMVNTMNINCFPIIVTKSTLYRDIDMNIDIKLDLYENLYIHFYIYTYKHIYIQKDLNIYIDYIKASVQIYTYTYTYTYTDTFKVTDIYI